MRKYLVDLSVRNCNCNQPQTQTAKGDLLDCDGSRATRELADGAELPFQLSRVSCQPSASAVSDFRSSRIRCISCSTGLSLVGLVPFACQPDGSAYTRAHARNPISSNPIQPGRLDRGVNSTASDSRSRVSHITLSRQ